jgi:hypothetical protein
MLAGGTLVERRQPSVGTRRRGATGRPVADADVGIARVVRHPRMRPVGIRGWTRREIAILTPTPRVPVVTPRSGHATILPHRGGCGRAGDRCGLTFAAQALLMAMDTVDTEDRPDLEAVLMGAVEQARAAIIEFSGEDTLGEYLGASFEDPTAATHRFLAVMPGYKGWQWAVVVAACPGADHATISEVVLVPGPTALLAPKWVPWHERVKPGDLSPGDLLAPPADDPRLVPGYMASGDPQVDEVAVEVGLGRRQVLSELGRSDAARRWHDGDFGPGSAMARSTRRVCRDCGFYVPLAGALGAMFGVCANELAADGHVVESEYGCGAHSDTPQPAGTGSPLYDPFDDGVLDVAEPES